MGQRSVQVVADGSRLTVSRIADKVGTRTSTARLAAATVATSYDSILCEMSSKLHTFSHLQSKIAPVMSKVALQLTRM